MTQPHKMQSNRKYDFIAVSVKKDTIFLKFSLNLKPEIESMLVVSSF